MYTYKSIFIIIILTIMIISLGLNNCIRAYIFNFDRNTHMYWVSAIITALEIAAIYIIKFKVGYKLEFRPNGFIHGALFMTYLYTWMFRIEIGGAIHGNDVCYLDKGEMFYTFCYAYPIAFWGCRLLIE